jgi:hypothetical protein
MEANVTNPSDDPVIDAVKRLNSGWNNTDYSRRDPVQLGKASLYTVAFKGQDGYWRENYVYELANKRIPYSDLKQLLTDRNNGLVSTAKDRDFFALLVVAALASIFALAVIYLAIWQPDNSKSLQALTGVFGLVFGYFLGTSRPGQRSDGNKG